MASAEKKIKDDIAKLDLYGILGVSHDVNEKAIVKAYRKKALKCHPDKNPDNPAAIEMFHQLSKALEILTDQAARIAYDKILKARKAAELRLHELDSKRRKLREDLEAREKAAAANQNLNTHSNISTPSDKEKLEAEILRLRKDGSRLLLEEQERLQREIHEKKKVITINEDEDSQDDIQVEEPPRLKLKWKAKKGDPDNGGYTKDLLEKLFGQYGVISALLISMKKSGSAVVEFVNAREAEQAFEQEEGLKDNPLTVSWITGKPKPNANPNVNEKTGDINSGKRKFNDTLFQGFQSNRSTFPTNGNNSFVSGFSFISSNNETSFNKSDQSNNEQNTNLNSEGGEMDFESLVFMRMRQAQERKRLAEEIERNEDQQTEKEEK